MAKQGWGKVLKRGWRSFGGVEGRGVFLTIFLIGGGAAMTKKRKGYSGSLNQNKRKVMTEV